ncbi:MAG: phospholipid carrier-dependent glycosyltransferase [Chloroflexi bacterium]|nr:phospholipid carrier-dependent glycosyltransferase [Chloroflexota bacterium]
MTKRQISTVLIIGFGLVSWLIISASPTSRAELWYERSQIYLNAIRSGDLAQTYTQYHPGATTMAVGGASLVALDVLPLPTELLLPDNTTEPGIETAAIVWGQGLVMVGVMVGIAFTLRALTDDVWLPVAAMGLMAFSPYLLSNIRSVHVDAPVALYMALSALLVLVYHQRRQWGWLAASGVAGGLALLTKSPAVFLFPYVGLVLLTLAVEEIMHMQERTVQGLLMTGWRVIVLPLLAWAGVAAVIFFVFFPAMWVSPLFVLGEIGDAILFHAETPHDNPYFFAGQIHDGELGLVHYPVTIAFTLSAVVSGLIVIGVVLALLPRTRRALPFHNVVYGLLWAYVIFFIIQMTISAKTMPRYALPAYPVLIVIAAAALLHGTRLIEKKVSERAAYAFLIVPLVLQMALAVVYHPELGTHTNHLLGGGRVAQNWIQLNDQNEGTMALVNYVHAHASEDTVISLQQPLRLTWVRFTQLEILLQELGGDYVVLQHNMTVREHKVDEWGHWLDLLEGQDPAAAFVVDGVTYQWLYDVNDPPAETTIYRDGWEGFVPLSWLWFLGTLGVTGAAALQQKQAPATQPQMGQLS